MLLVNNLIFERSGKIIFQDLNFSLSKNKIIEQQVIENEEEEEDSKGDTDSEEF